MENNNTQKIDVLAVVTKKENEKLKELALYFNIKNHSATITKAASLLKEIELLEFNEPPRAKNEFITKHFMFEISFIKALEDYGTSHFRDRTNTIRFIINGAYKILLENNSKN